VWVISSFATFVRYTNIVILGCAAVTVVEQREAGA
jgi:hypothetical protein